MRLPPAAILLVVVAVAAAAPWTTTAAAPEVPDATLVAATVLDGAPVVLTRETDGLHVRAGSAPDRVLPLSPRIAGDPVPIGGGLLAAAAEVVAPTPGDRAGWVGYCPPPLAGTPVLVVGSEAGPLETKDMPIASSDIFLVGSAAKTPAGVGVVWVDAPAPARAGDCPATGTVRWAEWSARDSTWTEPVVVMGARRSNLFASVSAHGLADGTVLTVVGDTHRVTARARRPDGTWTAPQFLSARAAGFGRDRWAGIATEPDPTSGALVALWGERGLTLVSAGPDGRWAVPHRPSRRAVDAVALDISPGGRATVAWIDDPRPRRRGPVRVVTRDPGTTGWRRIASAVSDAVPGPLAIASDDAGTGVVAWLGDGPVAGRSRPYRVRVARTSSASSRLSSSRVVATLPDRGLVDYRIDAAQSSDGRAAVAVEADRCYPKPVGCGSRVLQEQLPPPAG